MRLIDADKELECARKNLPPMELGFIEYFLQCCEFIDPKSLWESGKWEPDPDSPGRHRCSRCKSNPYDNEADCIVLGRDFKEYLTKYCPDCGARMDLEG